MAIQRVETQGTFAIRPTATGSDQENRSAIQIVDRLAQLHNAQTHNNSCCIVRCFKRILDCIVRIFRNLFGSSQTQESTTQTTPSTTVIQTQQPTRTEPAPSQPAKPVVAESLQQAQQKLEEGIDVEAVSEKLKPLMPKIKNRGKDDEILWHHSDSLVFSLKSVSNLVFKSAPLSRSVLRNGEWLSSEQQMEHHFANMIKAQEERTKHNLNLLVIPHAKKFKIDDMTFIAQERMSIQPDEAQEQLYKLPGLDEAIEQLATFIKETGFNDVVWRNIPLLDTDSAFQGSRRIILIDLEHMGKAREGFYGSSNGSPGLIGCLFSPEQIDKVLAVAKRHGIDARIFSDPKAERMKEIEEDRALHAFYKEKGILDEPGKPIVVSDLTTLGLNLDEQETITERVTEEQDNAIITKKIKTQVTLRQAAEYVIAKINEEIAKQPYKGSVKAKRYILLNPNHDDILYRYNRLGLPSPPADDPAELMQKWPWRTINALVKHGHLFKLDRENGHGYFIQA